MSPLAVAILAAAGAILLALAPIVWAGLLGVALVAGIAWGIGS